MCKKFVSKARKASPTLTTRVAGENGYNLIFLISDRTASRPLLGP